MNQQEYLFSKLGEECNEIAQMTSKINCFGIDEVFKDKHLNPEKFSNRERLINEINDLFGIIELLQLRGALPKIDQLYNKEKVLEKRRKVTFWMQESVKNGTLKEARENPLD
jgi:hypothetical protein